MYLLDGQFVATSSEPAGWTHIVLNYIGPNDGEGLRIYYNGQEVPTVTFKNEEQYSAGDSRIVVGYRYTDHNQDAGDCRYVSVQVDELVYFNVVLTDSDIQSIYNSA